MAVAYWVESMRADLDVLIEQRRETLMQAELSRFMEHTLGKPAKGPVWHGLSR